MNDFIRIPHYEHEYKKISDWHAVNTICVGELIEAGFLDWEDESWHWDAYNDEQYERVCEKFNNRFFKREIECETPGDWKREILSKFNLVMPKYSKLYAIMDDAKLNRKDLILQDKNKYGKRRDINSSFPQTQLGNNSDYASSGKDNEYEDIENGNFLEKFLEFANDYDDIDVLLLNEFENYFIPFLAVNVNGF